MLDFRVRDGIGYDHFDVAAENFRELLLCEGRRLLPAHSQRDRICSPLGLWGVGADLAPNPDLKVVRRLP